MIDQDVLLGNPITRLPESWWCIQAIMLRDDLARSRIDEMHKDASWDSDWITRQPARLKIDVTYPP